MSKATFMNEEISKHTLSIKSDKGFSLAELSRMRGDHIEPFGRVVTIVKVDENTCVVYFAKEVEAKGSCLYPDPDNPNILHVNEEIREYKLNQEKLYKELSEISLNRSLKRE